MTPSDRKQEKPLASRAVQATFLIVLIVLWYLATTRWRVSPLLLPNPLLVWDNLWDIIKTGEFVGDLRVTLTELVIAFAYRRNGHRCFGRRRLAWLRFGGHRLRRWPFRRLDLLGLV